MLSAYLQEAHLSGTLLKHANLSRANLSNVDMIEANLQNANLSFAWLSNANLSDADLQGVVGMQTIVGNQRKGVIFSADTEIDITAPEWVKKISEAAKTSTTGYARWDGTSAIECVKNPEPISVVENGRVR